MQRNRLFDVLREVVLTCSIGRLNLGDNGLHIYLTDNLLCVVGKPQRFLVLHWQSSKLKDSVVAE